MSLDLPEFKASLAAFGASIKKEHSKKVKAVAKRLATRIITLTPVDTGRAKANWSVSLAKPSGKSDWNTSDQTGIAAIQECLKAIDNSDPLTQVIWIENNLVYIEPLENGHSGQAPFGMLGPALYEERMLGDK